jgi:PAS domain S-box-containing protein
MRADQSRSAAAECRIEPLEMNTSIMRTDNSLNVEGPHNNEDRLRRISSLMSDVAYSCISLPVGGHEIDWMMGAAERVTGYSIKEIKAHGCWKFMVLEEDQPLFAQNVSTLAPGEQKTCELRIRHKEGNIVWLASRAECVRISKNPVTLSIYGALVDITARKLAELALYNERQRLTAIIKGANVGTWEWNIPAATTVLDERWADIIGYTLAEISPVSIQTWNKFTHPEDRKTSEQVLEKHLRGELPHYEAEVRMRHKDGRWIWILDQGRVTSWSADGKPLLMHGTHTVITERKRSEAALEKRLTTLTSPLDQAENVTFEDLFDLPAIQRLQDEFAKATGVASIITRPDGTPITRPTNFCRLCQDLIRGTEKGLCNCFRSDALLGRHHPEGPVVQPCLSGGLWDAGASITVGDRHIANWLIGQVRNEEQSEEKMRDYARAIGANETAVITAFYEVPAMPAEQFKQVAQALFTLANQLSTTAYQNVQQARFIAARQRAEADFEMLFNQMIDGFALHEIICDASGKPVDYRFLQVNPAFEKLTGLKKDLVIGRTMREITPQIESFWIETYGRVALSGEPTFFEHLDRESNRHFEVSAFRPTPGQFACVFVDITERKQSEAEVFRYQAQLEAIYENAPVMMCLVNQAKEVERMNRAMAEFVEVPLGDRASGRPGDVLGCLHALNNPSGCGSGPHCETCVLRVSALKTFTTGVPLSRVETTMEIVRGDKKREVRLSASMALVHSSSEDRLLLCLEDITSRQQLERQFLQSQKMEAVGQLAGGVAHDFNNILAAMLMHLHLLREEHAEDAPLVGGLQDLEQHARRAADLTRQLLLFSRRQAAQIARLNVNAIIDGMAKMLRRVLGEHIEMDFRYSTEDQGVDGDSGMLEQVVMNLCLNARDAMPNGGRLTLTTQTVDIRPDQPQRTPEARPGRFVCLRVNDTGCGMEEGVLKRIFEPFFTTKEVGRGTGLGLATVYGIVHQHQGWLEVESTVGAGSTFRVFLPQVPLHEGHCVEKHLASLPPGTETILAVEDEPGLLKLVGVVLRQCGYRVLEARDGVEALRLWEETDKRPDLLLTDMVMPRGISGLELIKRLRHSQPSLKAILSTGYSLALIRNGAQSPPGVRILTKPYPPADLAAAVREVLDEKEPS